MTATVLTALAIIGACGFAFMFGFHDGGNVLATMISSRALSPCYALVLGAVAVFVGAVLMGAAVTRTVGGGILDPANINLWVVLVGLAGAMGWNMITWYTGIPSSSSQALIGGLLGGAGAAALSGEVDLQAAVNWTGVGWILVVLIVSTPLGLSLGYGVTRLCFFLARGATPRAERVFRRMQLVSSFFVGMSQGSNDAPKAAGVMIMSLLISQRLRGQNPVLTIPGWVVWVSGAFLALGILRVGWRIVRTVGRKLFRVRTVHAFGAQSATVTIVLLSSLLGFPVSTTQIVTSAVAGAGAADRPKAVHWLVFRSTLIAWLFTIPGSGALAAAVYLGTRMLRS